MERLKTGSRTGGNELWHLRFSEEEGKEGNKSEVRELREMAKSWMNEGLISVWSSKENK